LRVDGTVNKMEVRQSRIDEFNSNNHFFCFLLTTQVGGVGLNLTGANRVIIFDPSWNNLDDQAVDRAYRIGQTKNVIIYRLITCGTIEEKMYRKQVYKASLSHSMTQKDQKHHRYFTSIELSEIFRLDDPKKSKTQKMLHKLHSHKRKRRESLDVHIDWLSSLEIFGISDHDLLFSEQNEKIVADGSHLKEVKERVKFATKKLHSSSSQNDLQKQSKKRKRQILTISNDNAEIKRSKVYQIDSDEDDNYQMSQSASTNSKSLNLYYDDEIIDIDDIKPQIILKSPTKPLEEISDDSNEDLPSISLTRSSSIIFKQPTFDDLINSESDEEKTEQIMRKPKFDKIPKMVNFGEGTHTTGPNRSLKDVFTTDSKKKNFIDLT